jgi:hypothetical protein
MPTRFSAAVQYSSGASGGGDGVNVEIDVSATVDAEFDESTGRWRDSKGRFTSAPEIRESDVRAEMERVRSELVENMKRRGKQSLADSLEDADIGIEAGEMVGGRERGGSGGDEMTNVIRFKDGEGNIEGRYEVDSRGNVRRRR